MNFEPRAPRLEHGTRNFEPRRESSNCDVALLTACKDPHYALGLAPALAAEGVRVEFFGDEPMARSGLLSDPSIHTRVLRDGADENSALLKRSLGLLRYYFRLLSYSARSEARILHILWWRRFVHFERTFLNLYFKALGKKLVFTAHNVNTEERDRRDSGWNRLTLGRHYRMMDHVFVHTTQMKEALMRDFGLSPEKVTVVRFPLNDVTPQSDLTSREAREKLEIHPEEKVLLFFGNIADYKGLEDVVHALARLRSAGSECKLLLIGNVKKGEHRYFRSIQKLISELRISDLIAQRIEYIPEEEVEIYFKAADLCLLPYRRIYQSGVLLLAYSFGLPAIASDVGGLPEEVVEGETGYVCRAADPGDLADKIALYFESSLYRDLGQKRDEIRQRAETEHSWKSLAQATCRVYRSLAG